MRLAAAVGTVVLTACTHATTTTSTATDSTAPPAGCSFQVAPSPAVGNGSLLSSVAALSDDDIWAVGGVPSPGTGTQPLIEHWDGTNWSVATAPSVPHGVLNDVAGSSTSDVWAVGSIGGFNGGSLIEHWNGATWSVVTAPRLPEADYLTSIVALNPSDAWAVGAWWVGGTGAAGHYTALVERWDGVRWVVANSPPAAVALGLRRRGGGSVRLLSARASLLSVEPGDHPLTSVDASSATDVWVAGWTWTRRAGGYQQFIARWNGRTWASMAPGAGTVRSVSTVSSNTAWGFVNGRDRWRVTIERWSHDGWAEVAAPSVGPALVGGSIAVGPEDAWMVGQRLGSRNDPLIERWNGTRWAVVAPPPVHAALYGVAVTPTGSVVAVGQTTTNGPQRTVIIDGC